MLSVRECVCCMGVAIGRYCRRYIHSIRMQTSFCYLFYYYWIVSSFVRPWTELNYILLLYAQAQTILQAKSHCCRSCPRIHKIHYVHRNVTSAQLYVNSFIMNTHLLNLRCTRWFFRTHLLQRMSSVFVFFWIFLQKKTFITKIIIILILFHTSFELICSNGCDANCKMSLNKAHRSFESQI